MYLVIQLTHLWDEFVVTETESAFMVQGSPDRQNADRDQPYAALCKGSVEVEVVLLDVPIFPRSESRGGAHPYDPVLGSHATDVPRFKKAFVPCLGSLGSNLHDIPFIVGR